MSTWDSEETAIEGLNISGYRFKWKEAKALVSNQKANVIEGIPYWERVRKTFLELGGCYIDQDERDRDRRVTK